jgi:hypothetical protein
MIKLNCKVVLYFVLFVPAIFYWYLNSVIRVEYEHDIRLPSGVKIFEVKSEWWILKSNKTERQLKARLEIPKNELISLLHEGDWKHFAIVDSNLRVIYKTIDSLSQGQMFFIENDNYLNVRHWIKIENLIEGKVIFELKTTFS